MDVSSVTSFLSAQSTAARKGPPAPRWAEKDPADPAAAPASTRPASQITSGVTVPPGHPMERLLGPGSWEGILFSDDVDNHPDKTYASVEVNGSVVAVIFNNGTLMTKDGFNPGNLPMDGPDLAKKRAELLAGMTGGEIVMQPTAQGAAPTRFLAAETEPTAGGNWLAAFQEGNTIRVDDNALFRAQLLAQTEDTDADKGAS